MIVAVPLDVPLAVTTPLVLTVALLVSLLDHIMVLFEASEGLIVTVSWSVFGIMRDWGLL